MFNIERTAFQQEVVKSLIESKAINFDTVGAVIAQFSERAALGGHDLTHIINRHVMINCGWPGPVLDVQRGNPVQRAG